MKKTTLLLFILTLIVAGMAAVCDPHAGIPNPGFGVVAVNRLGLFEKPLPGAVADWQLLEDLPISTGKRTSFRTTGGNSGQSLVDDGRAPASYRIRAVANWGPCDGLGGTQSAERGVYNYVPCGYKQRSIFASALSPISIDVTAAPLEFKAYADGIDITFGMSTFQFINEYGTLAAQTQATGIAPDNLSVSGWSNCLSGLPPGPYDVRVMNATADGVGQELGISQVYLYGGSIQSPIDDTSLTASQIRMVGTAGRANSLHVALTRNVCSTDAYRCPNRSSIRENSCRINLRWQMLIGEHHRTIKSMCDSVILCICEENRINSDTAITLIT